MSRGRRLLLSAATLTVGLVGAEILAHLAVAALDGDLRAVSLALTSDDFAEATPPIFTLEQEVLHPFLGYVQNPEVTEYETLREQPARGVDRFGFAQQWGLQPRQDPPEGAFRVAVVGGSMALMLSLLGDEALAQSLEPVVGRPVAVENWAMGGYKQPQQLMTVAWRLALGERPDAIINLDGYNDLVLGFTENLPDGVFPFYPRSWRWRVADVPNPAAQQLVGRLAALRHDRSRVAEHAERIPWRWSGIARLLAVLVRRPLDRRIARAESELAERGAAPPGYTTTGPPFSSDPGVYVDEAVAIWSRSSRQIDAMCRGLGIVYLHFLQPNQHVEGSKPMGRRERSVAIDDGNFVARMVARHYGRFGEAGAELTTDGIAFRDLRFAFEGIEEQLYIDSCCHVGRLGNQVLGRVIGETLAEALRDGGSD